MLTLLAMRTLGGFGLLLAMIGCSPIQPKPADRHPQPSAVSSSSATCPKLAPPKHRAQYLSDSDYFADLVRDFGECVQCKKTHFPELAAFVIPRSPIETLSYRFRLNETVTRHSGMSANSPLITVDGEVFLALLGEGAQAAASGRYLVLGQSLELFVQTNNRAVEELAKECLSFAAERYGNRKPET